MKHLQNPKSTYIRMYTHLPITVTMLKCFSDLPTVTNISNTSRICPTYFDISWDAPSITCGDASYNVLVSQSQIEGEAVEVSNVTVLNNSYSVTGLNNALRNVTITVTAIDRVGQRNGSMFSVQLPESLGKCCTYKCNIRYLFISFYSYDSTLKSLDCLSSIKF